MAHLAAIVDSSNDAIISKTPDGIITSWNQAAEKLYGYSAEEAVGRNIDMLVPKDRLEELHLITEKVLQGERIRNLQTVRLARGGREVEVSLTLSPVFDPQGTLTGISMIARENAERIQMERILRESERYYRTLVERAPDAVLVHRDGLFLYANCAALGVFGAKAVAEIQKHTIFDLIHPDDRQAMRESIGAVMGGEAVSLLEFRLLRLDGNSAFLESTSTQIEYQGGTAVQMIARDVSERKAAEAEREMMARQLAFQQTRFEAVVEQLPVAIVIAQAPSGRIVYHNELTRNIFRQDVGVVESFADFDRWKMYHLDGTPVPIPEFPLVRAIEKGEPVFGEEYQISRGDGTRGYISINATPLRDISGNIISGLATFSDITQSRAAAKALFESEERLKLALDAAEMGSCDMDVASGKGIWSRRHYLLMGYPPPEVEQGAASVGMWQDLIHPDDKERVLAALDRARKAHDLFSSEHRIIRVDNGKTLWVNVLGRFLCEAASCRFIGVIFDVSERKATEEKLRASETRFRWLYESSLVAIFFWNRDGVITDANDAYCDLVGYTAEECRGGKLTLAEVTAPEDYAKEREAMDQIMSRGISRTYEKVFIRYRTKERVAALTAIARMEDTAQEGIGFAVDLTELKRAEQALKNSEATLKLAVETTGLGIFDVDLVTGKGEWSPIAKHHYGLPTDARVDLGYVLRLVHPDDRARLEQIVKDARSPAGAGFYSAEYRSIGVTDQKVRWLSMRARVTYDEDGMPLRLAGACLNITDSVLAQEALREEMTERVRAVEELRRQEQLLIRQGRMAAMGEMIANIAHQWRQPLNTLGLIVQELPIYYERNLFSGEYLQQSVGRAMQVINYMSETIDGFRNFFGPDKEKQKFPAAEILEQTLTILQGAFVAAKVEVEVEADPETEIFGIPNEYSQVILNILMNAKDALLERGVANPKIEVRLFRENGRAVLTVQDNAGGIPPEIMEKVFDPYFTTKGPDQGTGIGLFMSKTIIEKNMNGSLTVCNTDRGARFRIEV